MSQTNESAFDEHDFHVGLAGLELDQPAYELGSGIQLRQTYAHLFAPFLLAFARPSPGLPHPGPWTSARGGVDFDITAELFIPVSFTSPYGKRSEVAAVILFLLRLGVDPGITSPVLANNCFSSLPELPADEVRLVLNEVEHRSISLSVENKKNMPVEAAQWVQERWEVVLKLMKNHAEFVLAVEALDKGQFVQSTALALVSLWAALEALFSPSTAELKFRVSALIASYLEVPGPDRLARQKFVAKLYDKRSGAAHGIGLYTSPRQPAKLA